MTDQRDQGPFDTTKDPLDPDHGDSLESDRPSGWAGVDDALGGTGNRPAGPDYGAGPRDDTTPGSQDELADRDPAEGERTDDAS